MGSLLTILTLHTYLPSGINLCHKMHNPVIMIHDIYHMEPLLQPGAPWCALMLTGAPWRSLVLHGAPRYSLALRTTRRQICIMSVRMGPKIDQVVPKCHQSTVQRSPVAFS